MRGRPSAWVTRPIRSTNSAIAFSVSSAIGDHMVYFVRSVNTERIDHLKADFGFLALANVSSSILL
jgi:hypothetical protein